MFKPKFLILLATVALLAACQDAPLSQKATSSPPPAATSTPTVPTRLTASPSPTPQPSPSPGELLYVDPDGRYQVLLPADWRPDQPGSYAGPGGYFRTVNLPEMGFYSRAYQVCMRIIQNLNEPAAPLLLPSSDKIDSCEVAPLPYNNPLWARAVFKAPGMPPEKSYFYIESDGAHAAYIFASLKMLVPTGPDDFYVFPSGALRPADQIFWNTPRQPAVGLTLMETRLAAPASDHPAKNFRFPDYIPRELWLAIWEPKPTATPDPLVTANLVLARFGYELRLASINEVHGPYVLYQDGKIIREQISSWEAPILSASGQDFALFLNSTNGREVLRRGGLEQWEKYGGLEPSYRFSGESLLAPIWNSNFSSIDVRKENQLLYRFEDIYGTDPGLQTFQVWQDHWLLEARGFLVQDGAILNDALGYEEIYGWQLLNGKPFYFFRKGPRVGISYDGQVQPVYYDEVAHYMCCGFSGNNPFNNGLAIHFFALREGVWYFVTFASTHDYR